MHEDAGDMSVGGHPYETVGCRGKETIAFSPFPFAPDLDPARGSYSLSAEEDAIGCVGANLAEPAACL